MLALNLCNIFFIVVERMKELQSLANSQLSTNFTHSNLYVYIGLFFSDLCFHDLLLLKWHTCHFNRYTFGVHRFKQRSNPRHALCQFLFFTSCKKLNLLNETKLDRKRKNSYPRNVQQKWKFDTKMKPNIFFLSKVAG